MRVRLIEELFGSDVYDLEITKNGFVFSKAGGCPIRVPFGDMKHFNLEGKGQRLRRFVLETNSKTYEGTFLLQGDSDKVIAQLREKCGCYVDIRLDME